MTRPLQQTTAIITGASSGIGAATAQTLADLGANVALLARRADRLTELADQINAGETGRARVWAVDVTDEGAVTAAMSEIAEAFGGIDLLVNGAGVGTWAPARESRLSDWRAMVEVNINGVLTCTHAALPYLVRAAEGGRKIADIVTVSSIAGRRVPGPNSNVYSATKHAVNAFSEALRRELAEQHVRVGVVEPGIVTTEMTTSGDKYAPDARNPSGLGFLQAGDIADAIGYMVTRPRHATINEILIRPTEQAA
ncbi:SDR family oxidoreductase [Salinisphaera sp. T31B1]|uniref:SDR family oxidoreductase n=1 Tax=Salinisphaera sp. T31B1 TaxID=727963 RepID=UPI003342618D